MVQTNPLFQPKRISTLDIGLSGKWLLSVITLCCSSAFFLVGWENGILGGLIETREFQTFFHHPDANMIGNVVSLYQIGCFCGALFTFVIGDRLGRRKVMIVGGIWMMVGTILQATCSTIGVMILGRIISGIGMGAVNSTAAVFQAETSPTVSRGKLVSLNLMVLNIGILLSYWTDYAFNCFQSNVGSILGSQRWRIPIALQCGWIMILLVTASILPDTPQWLISRGRDSDAFAVLERLPSNHSTSQPDQQQQQQQAPSSIPFPSSSFNHPYRWISPLLKPNKDNWKDDDLRSRRRLFLACFLQTAQQLGGINALISFSTTLFHQSIHLNPSSSLLASTLHFSLLFGSIICLFLIDRVGRKPLLLSCLVGMTLVMSFQTGLIYRLQHGPRSSSSPSSSSSLDLPLTKIFAYAMIFLFELFFSIGFQATVWLIPSEVLPTAIRTKGSALSTSLNWITNFVIVKLTPTLFEKWGYKTYLCFAVLNACWIPILAIFLPETKGRNLQDMDQLFRGY